MDRQIETFNSGKGEGGRWQVDASRAEKCGNLWKSASKCRLCWLTIGILCLEAISLDYHRREYDYLWFILGGGVQQAIMTIRIDTEGALCVQIHFVLVVCKLCSGFRK